MFNNEDLNQVTWEQRVMEGNPKFEASQTIPNVPTQVRRADRPEGHLRRRSPAHGGGLGRGAREPVPVVLEVKTDPEVPPLPPFFTLQQVQNFMSMLGKGDPRSATSSSTPRVRC